MPYSTDLCTGGTATASSTNGSNAPSQGFDDTTSTKWQASHTSSPQWLKCQFGSASAVSKLRLRPDYSATGSVLLIKNFNLYGSNDDSSWDLLLTDATSSNSDQWFEYEFANGTQYIYYKLEVIDHWHTPFSGYFTGVKEMEMMAKLPLSKSFSISYHLFNPVSKVFSALFPIGYKSALSKSFAVRYEVKQLLRKILRPRYSITQVSTKIVGGVYHLFKQSTKKVDARYSDLPPLVEFVDVTGALLFENFLFGLKKTGELSDEFFINLWNNRNGTEKLLSMGDVKISVTLFDGSYSGGRLEEGQEMIDEKWLEAKSSGVTGTGITDDAQTVFTPIGGDPAIGGLAVGDIPSGTARKISFRLNIPADAETPFSLYPALKVSYRAANSYGYGFNYGRMYGGKNQ
jgi:hypothetical protein